MRKQLLVVLAGLLLAGCAAHGQSSRINPKVHRNITPYTANFYRELIADKAYVFEGIGRYRNIVHGRIYSAGGAVIECAPRHVDGKFYWLGSTRIRGGASAKPQWSQPRLGSGGYIKWDLTSQLTEFSFEFYHPKTGGITSEAILQNSHVLLNIGQIQDSWPRAVADACPDLKLPAHIRINEKQTSLRMDELRRQDPDAPIRNFPGSQMTAPGRTGLGASGGKPTTTKAEVWAFMRAQHGNIVLSEKGNGRALVLGNGNRPHELWQLEKDGRIVNTSEFHEVKDKDGEWLEGRRDGKMLGRYPMGYPFPYLPTGHRHAAFQLTDKLIGWPRPRSLPFMGQAYADRRFVFHPEGKFSVVDEAGNLVEGPHFDGVWRWTRGMLEMTVRDDPAGPKTVRWRTLADQLGMTPTVWTQSTPDRY